jgi:capsular polysaccharide export protein
MIDNARRRPRRFLFLQGLATSFFTRLGAALMARGHAVVRVNFNGGDRVFWRLPGAIDFRGTLEEWPEFLAGVLDEHGVTDVVLFGDCRPLHRAAIKLAGRRSISVHVFEEGYMRPSWITHEIGAVNAYSSLPRDPDWYREIAKDTPPFEIDRPLGSSFLRRVVEDVLYNVSTVALAWYYAGYRTHRPWHPFVEYAGWIRKFALQPFAQRRSARLMRMLTGSRQPFYFFPLQLDCDFQIRVHSPFRRIEPAIDCVISSFARHAPADSHIVIKAHPLDNGLTNWRRVVERIATARGVAARVLFLDDGDLGALLRRARGVVTVNSTVGTLALGEGVPVIALGHAIYDIAGLTYQGDLDDFWVNGRQADPELFEAYRRVVGARALIHGGFFSEQALSAAVSGSVAKLEAAAACAPISLQSAADNPVDDSRFEPLRAAASGL